MTDKDSLLNRVFRIPQCVLFQEVSGESVLLDLESEQYFGLDEVGTRVWQLVEEHGRLSEVYDEMLNEFDVDPATLRQDLLELVATLADRGLIQAQSSDPPRHPRDGG
jgi:hypothetical protein